MPSTKQGTNIQQASEVGVGLENPIEMVEQKLKSQEFKELLTD